MDPNLDAQECFRKGRMLKQSGRLDVALTEFRRAVLADPNFFEAHLEVGLLCRKKSETDPFFRRHAFEAFQKAARLNLSSQDAHDHYIMAAQKQGLLDQIHHEYDELARQHPDNDLIKRCRKNILTISLAMVPEKVNIQSSSVSGTVRKFLLFGGLGGMFLGAVLLFAPLFLSRGANPMIKPENVKHFVRIGGLMEAVGVGMIIGRFFLK